MIKGYLWSICRRHVTEVKWSIPTFSLPHHPIKFW